MKVVQEALAGTLESSDLFVRVSPIDGPLELIVNSEVAHQFGDQIRKVVEDALTKFGVTEGATVIIEDKGALDCVIEARVEAALMRAAGNKAINWEVLS
ncbi:citrate lyase subunit gamma (acyl carrier protein) [Cohaesibacter sp. ES.047]|uniref:citrate lyase acyl carrier protein n=1 Tax=Cohaesibacter sp. ES.047 TaxID=1798205 RepID=UPI000BB8CA00|nr:citrate lyase acyl carrier protein [Cohaesibacter sp. ES.047]SNY93195.1 citrate lyase subunit gamma (acyl carrier protein) [Cohaesibacter sp. ES.047]